MIKNFAGKIERTAILFIVLLISGFLLGGCDTSGDEQALDEATEDSAQQTETTQNNESAEPKDYDDYISQALSAVKEDSYADVNNQEDFGQVVVVNPKEEDDEIYVSASDSLPEDSGISPSFAQDEDADEEKPEEAKADDKEEEAASESDDKEADAEDKVDEDPTPNEFEVGKSCIYINGEIDDTYGSDIITALNKARTDLGYPALTEKDGLDACADRRTREIACYLSHMRPNAQPFYSLAPQYFKAEMLAIDGAKPAETIDAWIRDPYSRGLVFTTGYTSVGAACFKCNGLNCVVVAFGY